MCAGRSCYCTRALLLFQPLGYLPIDKGYVCTRVKKSERGEVSGGREYGHKALTISAVNVRPSAVAGGQVRDDISFVFSDPADITTAFPSSTIVPAIIVSSPTGATTGIPGQSWGEWVVVLLVAKPEA